MSRRSARIHQNSNQDDQPTTSSPQPLIDEYKSNSYHVLPTNQDLPLTALIPLTSPILLTSLVPLTSPRPDSPTTQSLLLPLVPNLSTPAQNQGILTYTYADLVRFRGGHFSKNDDDVLEERSWGRTAGVRRRTARGIGRTGREEKKEGVTALQRRKKSKRGKEEGKQSNEEGRGWRRIGRVEGAWRRWEEVGGIGRGMGGLALYGYDKNGEGQSW